MPSRISARYAELQFENAWLRACIDELASTGTNAQASMTKAHSASELVPPVDATTVLGRTIRLFAEGFFDNGAQIETVWRRLRHFGHDGSAGIYEACEWLVDMGFLTNEVNEIGYRAIPGMKSRIEEIDDPFASGSPSSHGPAT